MIRFENVSKTYARGQRPALDGIDLEIERGEFVFVVGQSGSGKSTLLRLVLREEQATDGQIFVAGHNLRRLPHRKVPRLRRNMGTVFQDFRLLPNKTVAQNVAFALQVIGRPSRQIKALVPETLEMVGLAGKEKRYPHELSGGEQQRVALARAVVNRPPILLADEPTGNLDPVTSLEIVRLLERIHQSGTTVLMATHDDAIVDALRKRVVELDDGHVVRDERDGTYILRGETLRSTQARTIPHLPRTGATAESVLPDPAGVPKPGASSGAASVVVDQTTPRAGLTQAPLDPDHPDPDPMGPDPLADVEPFRDTSSSGRQKLTRSGWATDEDSWVSEAVRDAEEDF